MRIIAGHRRGHRLEGPKGRGTRPTSDLVRESLFNIVGEEVEGRLVLDLFAGTGALGLEALSRGASRALFVERRHENAALIRRNLATLRYEDRGEVIVADAYRWAEEVATPPGEPVLVLLDPPYDDFERRPGRVRLLLDRLLRTLPPDSIVVAESRQGVDIEVLPDVDSWDLRRHGDTRLAVRYVAGAARPPAPDAGGAPT